MDLSLRQADCPTSRMIPAYANCTLEDDQVEQVDLHLPECDYCRETLAELIESGIGPNWLPSLRRMKRTNEDKVSEADMGTDHWSPSAELIAEAMPESPDDRYKLVRPHGEGGMGEVWLGWDVVLKRQVALKQLPAGQQHEKLVGRLQQEASSLARLSHPNIVSVFEIVVLDRKRTIVMEFIDGPNLAQFRKDSVLSERQAAQVLEKLTSAVVHAHEQRVIHRDLKPGNVLLYWPGHTDGGKRDIEHAVPKLTDFGLARIIEEDYLTRTGELLGTPAYMAPEQTVGQANLVGPSADIYGLGAILYELLVGTPPHVSDDPVSTLLAVREREPLAPRAIRPELSRDIETICLKCLRKMPKDRYAGAVDLRTDLLAFLEGRPIAARPLNSLVLATRWARRHKPVVLAAFTSLLLLLTILVGSLWTAANERKLRVLADQARQQARLSEQKLAAEADRANRALALNQEHFDVALDQVLKLSHFLSGVQFFGQEPKREDYHRKIDEVIKRIYATYLNSLPPPDQWTFREAFAVCLYVEMMNGLSQPDQFVVWQERLESIAHRLEQEYANEARLYDFLLRHNYALWNHKANTGELQLSGHYGEKSANASLSLLEHRPGDLQQIRHCSHVFMVAGQSYSRAGDHESAGRVANKSLSVFRQILSTGEATEEDKVSFLDKLIMHRQIFADGKRTEANEHVAEFHALAGQFEPTSEYYARVKGIVERFDAIQGPTGPPTEK